MNTTSRCSGALRINRARSARRSLLPSRCSPRLRATRSATSSSWKTLSAPPAPSVQPAHGISVASQPVTKSAWDLDFTEAAHASEVDPTDVFPLQCKEEPPMQGSTRGRTPTGSVVVHPLDPEDAAITAAFRAMVSSAKGARQGIDARGQFDAFMESVLPRDDVTFETDTLGGVPGLWVQPADWRSGEAIVHLHGGWFNFGSAKAYRHLVGNIAARTGARAFIPDYRLAPEHPFPAATDDVLA